MSSQICSARRFATSRLGGGSGCTPSCLQMLWSDQHGSSLRPGSMGDRTPISATRYSGRTGQRSCGVLIKGWRGRCSFLAPQVVSWSGFEPTAVSLNGWLAVGASQVPGWSPGWMQAEGNRSSAGSSTCHRRRPSVLRYGPWVGPWAQVSGRARTMRDQHGRWEALAAPEGHGGVLFRCALMDGAGP
jgi:hypothetical protein